MQIYTLDSRHLCDTPTTLTYKELSGIMTRDADKILNFRLGLKNQPPSLLSPLFPSEPSGESKQNRDDGWAFISQAPTHPPRQSSWRALLLKAQSGAALDHIQSNSYACSVNEKGSKVEADVSMCPLLSLFRKEENRDGDTSVPYALNNY